MEAESIAPLPARASRHKTALRALYIQVALRGQKGCLVPFLGLAPDEGNVIDRADFCQIEAAPDLAK
jgi:hypothetical protein